LRFLLVDEILEMEPGKSVTATKSFGAEADFFEDHFPGFPVVPGVLLVEMMAQTAGKCLNAQKDPRGLAMLARITSASFKEWLRPGETATMHAEIKMNRAAYATADCRITVDRNGPGNVKEIGRAGLFFAFLPGDQLAPHYRDDVLEDFLGAHGKPIGGDHDDV
jgi:3-hydroxyacyl-[acyl-carrier-protein] dehydratase